MDVRIVLATLLSTMLTASAASVYDQCILEHAPAIQTASTDKALELIMQTCIKISEEEIEGEWLAKVPFKPVTTYEDVVPPEIGFVAHIYNGSPFDITAITLAL